MIRVMCRATFSFYSTCMEDAFLDFVADYEECTPETHATVHRFAVELDAGGGRTVIQDKWSFHSKEDRTFIIRLLDQILQIILRK